MSQPDLTVRFEGLEEAKPGDNCYDPKQPWYVHVTVLNAKYKDSIQGGLDPNDPTGPAAACNLMLQVMKGKTLASGVAYSTYVSVMALDGYPAQGVFELGLSIQLPLAVKKAELGTLFAFRIEIDSGKTVPESEEGNNVFVWEKGTPPPLFKLGSGEVNPAPQPDEHLAFIDTAAVSSSEKQLKVQVQNLGSLPSQPMPVYLRLFDKPTPGTPVGRSYLGAIGQVPSLAPGNSLWILLESDTPFVHPHAPAVPRRSRRPAQHIRLRRGAGNVGGLVEVQDYRLVDRGDDFDVLIPFTLAFYHGFGTLGFGGPAIGSRKGPIRIPGKG
ncbi:MAG: hypothetical protein ABWY06_10330 [Pseudomonas sp.]|uniref:hypothetical protein n=1 Tax=Pseudomonas sp. TaxID=306 RepID=UPI00339A9C8C